MRSLHEKKNANIYVGSLIFCPTLYQVNSTVVCPVYLWKPELYGTVSLGSFAFWLWLGSSNERHQQERLQEGRRELGVFIPWTAA